jgi:multiple sugar transport system permease protein
VSGGAIAIDRRAASRRRRIVIENLQAYLFLLPAFSILFVFRIYPAIVALFISLYKCNVFCPFTASDFRGLQNYADILFGSRAPAFWQAVSTTVTYALMTLPFEMAFALVLAYLLFQKIRGRVIYRTLFYLPYITATVAAATVFEYIYHPQYGLVNTILSGLGIGPLRFLQEPSGVFEMIGNHFGWTVPDLLNGPSLALVSVAIFSTWHFLGFQIVVFLAGLGNIPVEYYEAARLDGATPRQVFTRITLPLLSPQIFFVFTIASIGVLRAFNEIFVLTNGGPLDTTRTISMLVFRTFFQQGQIGAGSAMGVLLTLIILLFTLVQFRILERRVQYG